MRNLEGQAVRLLGYRTIVVLTFFLATLGVQAFLGGENYLKPFYYLIAFILALNLFFIVLYMTMKPLRKGPFFIYVQIFGDILGITLLAFMTGGIFSIFTFLYQILIVVGGYFLKKRGAFVVAAMDAVFFGLLCVALVYSWTSPDRFGIEFPYEAPSIESALHALVAHYVGFFLVALLMGIISGRFESSQKALGVAEKDLSNTRMFTEQVVSSLNWGVISTDSTGVVTFSNPAGMRLLGETLPVGWNLFERIGQLGYDGPDLRAAGEPTDREFVLSPSGDHHLGIVIAPLRSGDDDSEAGYLALIRDQTEVVRLREQLAIKERLTATGAMAADIAHEIKNPLGSIFGAAQMLQMQAPEGTSQADLLQIIQDESKRLTTILDNFLRYVKPRPLEKEALDIGALVQDVVTLFRNAPECSDGVELFVDLPGGAVVIHADSGRIRQALWNLLQNARKAILAEGSIHVSLTEEGENAILAVEDNGQGMRQTQIKTYFQPFSRGFVQGSGLGLSVVYQIMEQHKGRVEIDSKLGRGTICRLYFPLGPRHG
jgi:two-component system sensor histidine kinase PilS (NtrC family)